MPSNTSVKNLLPKMIELYKTTQSTRKTAKALGIAKYTVLKYLNRIGIINNPIEYIQPNITVAEAAWLAGFIDGEGHFGIIKHKSEGSTSYRPRLTVANTNKDSILFVKKLAGGGVICCRKLSKKNIKWSDCFAINITGQALKHVIKAIKPYCVVKARNIEICERYYIETSLDKSAELKMKFKIELESITRNGLR